MRVNKKELEVRYKGQPVGRLALNNEGLVAFQYDNNWIKEGFSISPFSLPLSDRVFLPNNKNHEGLFGVFADSLPDSWGRLILDRMLLKNGIDLASVTALDRLSIIGKNGMGALEYYPEYDLDQKISKLSLDELRNESEKLLANASEADVDSLYINGGSSGGARPKALINYMGEDWIIKFPYSKDPYSSGVMEYEYSLVAKKCGIEMTKTKLFESKICEGYFGIKRFDRPKVHMVSAAALLEVDFERSVTDYAQLFKLTNLMTSGNAYSMEQMFLRMCFNVIMENQDDHLKNFAFLYDDKSDTWSLSPAYDLTRCITAYGEHTTLVNGKGKDISREDLIKVGTDAGIKRHKCEALLENVINTTKKNP